jgi:hypothetical protein
LPQVCLAVPDWQRENKAPYRLEYNAKNGEKALSGSRLATFSLAKPAFSKAALHAE